MGYIICFYDILSQQLALTKTLEQIIQEYRLKHEKRPAIVAEEEDNILKRIKNSQDTGIVNIEICLNYLYHKIYAVLFKKLIHPFINFLLLFKLFKLLSLTVMHKLLH